MISLILYNQHWQNGFFYPFEKERVFINHLKRNIDSKFILILAGLRRTGKTVLLLQTINYLIKIKNIPRENILYFTFDEEKIKIEDLLYEYEKQTGIKWKREKLFIFLDEIQKLDNFQNQIKIFYDLYPNLKFVISGSTSLFIKKKSSESLAGREITIYLPPLLFSEYLNFIDAEELLEKPNIFKKELELEFEKYWQRQFIETLKLKKDELIYYLKSLVQKIIFEDIPVIYNISEPDILIKIVKTFCNYPGTLINYEKLSNIFNVDRKTLSKYIKALTHSYLIKILYNFSKNLMRTEKKLKKAYMSSPSFVTAFNEFILNDDMKRNLLVENVVISVNNFNYFWRERDGVEVDFVDVNGEKYNAFEVKYKNKIEKEDIKNLILFKKRFKNAGITLLTKLNPDIRDKLKEDIEIIPVFDKI